jgi:hypothetical protein
MPYITVHVRSPLWEGRRINVFVQHILAVEEDDSGGAFIVLGTPSPIRTQETCDEVMQMIDVAGGVAQ